MKHTWEYRFNENSSKTIISYQNELHFNSPDELSKSISYDFARSKSKRVAIKEIDVTKGLAKMINM